MEMPDGKQRQPTADVSEAALWYLRSKAKYLQTEEIREFASWLRSSPENASTLLSIATRDHQRLARQSVTNRLRQAFLRALRTDRAQSRSDDRSLSYRYFDHLKRKYLLPKLGLFAVVACGGASWMFLDDARSAKIAAVALAGLLLLKIKETVVGFRVVSGYFGSTQSEVRDLLKFISARYDDHTDQKGGGALTKSALD